MNVYMMSFGPAIKMKFAKGVLKMTVSSKPVTTSSLLKMKEKKEPIAVITAYDYPTAMLVEKAGVEMILVGDSLGMVVLGYESTIPVTLNDMLHHTKAVTRAAKRAFVVVDMPFLTYHGNLDSTLRNAAILMQEGLAKAVKMEGGSEIAETISKLVQAGIPVMGHIGLTPQAVHRLGGYKVQGREPAEARKLVHDAIALEQAGVFAIVLECVPADLAKKISENVSVPTIGIGAGVHCDGQVLVFHDMLQYGSTLSPKFVKVYGNAGNEIVNGVSKYIKEVKNGSFPALEHSYTFHTDKIQQLYGEGNK